MENNTGELATFLELMDRYSPTIPEEVIAFYLNQPLTKSESSAASVGKLTAQERKNYNAQKHDPRINRMVALAAHKFISDVAHDALQYQKIRTHSKKETNNKQKLTLTTEDLALSLSEYGVNMIKPDYYCDKSTNPEPKN